MWTVFNLCCEARISDRFNIKWVLNRFILIPQGWKILLYSGGSDSEYLRRMLEGTPLILLHIDHLRDLHTPEEKFKHFKPKHRMVIIHSKLLGSGTERAVRYRLAFRLARKLNIRLILTAHNLCDRSYFYEAGGFLFPKINISDNVHILRPMSYILPTYKSLIVGVEEDYQDQEDGLDCYNSNLKYSLQMLKSEMYQIVLQRSRKFSVANFPIRYKNYLLYAPFKMTVVFRNKSISLRCYKPQGRYI